MFDCDMIVSGKVLDKKSFMTKSDIWLMSAVLVIALLILLVFRLSRTQGSYANVTCDGEVLIQIPLAQSEARYYLLTESIMLSGDEAQVSSGQLQINEEQKPAYDLKELSEEEWRNVQLPSCDYNVIQYQDGEVQMIESSCPDQICVHHSAVSATGENIICLPHKIVIEVIGDKEHELDGVTY